MVLVSVVAEHDCVVVLHHLLQVVGNPDVVAPVDPLLLTRSALGNGLSVVDAGIFLLEVFYAQSHSGQGKHQHVHSGLLLQPDVHPTPGSGLCRSLQGHSLPVLALFLSSEMMPGLDGVHESDVIEIGVHFEEVLPEVLGGLQVLQVPGYVVAGDELLALLSVALILEHHDLVDFEDGGDPGDLADEVGPQGTGLRHFQD